MLEELTHKLTSFSGRELDVQYHRERTLGELKNMSIKVSVVVPVYNQEAYLREALDSLKAQTLQEAEFIIVNDGSTDSSLKIIKEYAKDDARFVIIDKKNGGVGLAINTGIQAAQGEYIAELDSDDYVDPEMYANMYATAKVNDVDILKSNLINFTGSGETFEGTEEKIVKDKAFYGRIIDPSDEDIVFSFPMYAWTSLYRRELLIDNRIIWNESVSSYNDNGFYWQTMGMAKSVMYVDETYIYHRRDNELSTVKNPDKMFKNFFIEHDFIKQNLTERGIFEAVKGHFYERKINNYFFALNIIPFDKKQEFFRLIAADFTKDISEGGLVDSEFINPNNKKKIVEIVQNPDLYFYQVYLPGYYRVSVVVPVHNSGDFLRTTLENLVNQTLREIEIILIENGSTDDSAEIIQEYVKKDPRIVYKSIGEANAGAARNAGLEMAHGQYIIFLDADDDYSRDMLRRAFKWGQEKNADVVWFNSQERNFKNGLTRPLPHAFRVNVIPNKQPFAFRELKGNPYNAFVGWAWDKMFKLQYVRGNGFKFQEQAISNDGLFTFMAMSKAQRIATIKDVLISRVVGHGANISSTKHDTNPDNQFKMITETYQKLLTLSDEGKMAHNWAIRSLQMVQWLFTTGFSTSEGASCYFDILVTGGLEAIGLESIDEEELGPINHRLWTLLQKMKAYLPGEYQKFINEVGYVDFALKPQQIDNVYPVNTGKQEKSARLIFGQPAFEGEETVAPLLNILIDHADTSNVSVMIDFVYMGNFTPIAKDTLNLSLSINEHDGVLVPTVNQAEWDNGAEQLMNGLYYTFSGNVFTIYSKYLEQYTGVEWRIRTISSREGELHFSTIGANKGYKTTRFPKINNDLIPMKTVRNFGTQLLGMRTIFRLADKDNVGQNLFSVSVNEFQFNNVALSVDISYLPNLKPVVSDTLNLGFYINPTEDGLKPTMFQSDWHDERESLMDKVYYYIDGLELYVGVRYTSQYEGYTFKIKNIVSRELGTTYSVNTLAEEFIEHELSAIPNDAVFVSN